jgi:hypothetical protein
VRDKILKGILSREGSEIFLRSGEGKKYFSEAAIWEGYVKHWQGKLLRGRLLPETDYGTGKPIALLWPYKEKDDEPFVEIYYNVRLVKYTMSLLGHVAVNVNGFIFNFSHLLNECEIITEEEYFYRPALGMFSPSPAGLFDTSDPERPYLDKFGRQFMRTIHVARITWRETAVLESILRRKLKEIYDTPVDPAKPEYYRDFSKFSNSCSTIIRDSLREWSFSRVKGIFPREMFISAVWEFYKESRSGDLNLSVFKRNQLIVDEAPVSRLSPIVNPVNYLKKRMLEGKGVHI